MKYISTFILTLILALNVYSPVYAANPGTVDGNYYYTDIVTYLWNTPVNSINIGGVTLIDAESMSHYGFTVKWHSKERWLEILAGKEDISSAAKNGSLLDMKAGKTGTVAGKYYYTDIKTTLNGEKIISYNIGGRTFIGAEAMRDFGYDVIWDNNARALTISKDYLKPSWEWVFNDGTETTLNNGFTLEFANITTNDGVEFKLTEASGEYKSVGKLVYCDKSLTVVIYSDVNEYGDYWKLITDNRNIIYGERTHEDTPERRAELSRAFRISTNGVELGGEMSYIQGNGHSDYIFIYDKPLLLEDVKTFRLEVGFK
ncbi:MAG: hypothetical protein LBU32_31060 [Clostridiales bacterium]|jgi:hypothetical protein|nr:hypothetical protein [Clostridiales bacterium]